MDQQWERLGAALRSGREALGIAQQDMAERLGVQRNALRTLEIGGAKRITQTQRAYAREIGWTQDSIERVLAGGEPVLAEDSGGSTRLEAAVERLLPAGLTPRTVEELRSGRLVDQSVVDVTDDGRLAVVMLVVDRGTGEVLQPEGQEAADLREWSRRQRAVLRALTADDESTPR